MSRLFSSILAPGQPVTSGYNIGEPQALMSSLRCSFCHKSPEHVGKLISTPTDDPRAYICDQCIAVCVGVIEDDVAAFEESVPESLRENAHPLLHRPLASKLMNVHPLLTHPLAPKLMEVIETWMQEESLGNDALSPLSEVRRLAQHMLQDVSARKRTSERP
jgi:hypothetical protein